MDKVEFERKNNSRVPFWAVAMIIALLGILSYQLTHDAAISELLFLILIALVIIKVVPAVLRLFAILAVAFVLILILLAWAGLVLGS